MDFFAHSGREPDKSDWQSLPAHLLGVARLAAAFGAEIGLERAAFVAGLLHDLGKYDPDFQAKLDGALRAVDHSTAGAQVLLQRVFSEDAHIASLIAHAILGHHAGLPDTVGESDASLERRLKKPLKIAPAFQRAIDVDVSRLKPDNLNDVMRTETRGFALSFMGRMLFSCLVDADFKDTEAYYASIGERQADRDWPALADLLPDFLARFEAKIESFSPAEGIGEKRATILSHVRQGARMTPGLFTLTVPTGGGKTLASLGFALDHALQHGKRRILYAIPYTSIIDQTVDIFQDVLGAENVLAHHSAIDEETETKLRDREQRNKMKLAMEDWAAPVVVTTNVQFFESLFSARPSRTRKLHNIAHSIIILDEVQTLPRSLLLPCLRALEELATRYHCTVVLCTATQPALGKRRGFEGLELTGRELAPDPKSLATAFSRTRIVHGGEMDNAALVKSLGDTKQSLVIVNSRRHALELFQQAKEDELEGLVHLTTRQYPAHRKTILQNIRDRLSSDKPCRLVATSLVEAGVDLDFPVAWRAEAGLDQVVQAAGRVNRHGRQNREQSLLTVFSCPDYPPPAEVKARATDLLSVMGKHVDLTSPEAIEDYFQEVYWKVGKKGLDRHGILEKFSMGARAVDFRYREVGHCFRMIESEMVPVIVNIEENSEKSVDNLKFEHIPSGRIARDLQPYIVQIPLDARIALERNGKGSFACPDRRGDQFFVVTDKALYAPETGLLWENADYLAIESTIF